MLGWEALGAVQGAGHGQRRDQQLEGIAMGAGTGTYKALWDTEGNLDFLFTGDTQKYDVVGNCSLENLQVVGG